MASTSWARWRSAFAAKPSKHGIELMPPPELRSHQPATRCLNEMEQREQPLAAPPQQVLDEAEHHKSVCPDTDSRQFLYSLQRTMNVFTSDTEP